MTTEEQLEQLNEAISTIENGAQEYQIGSRRITKASLSTLYSERLRLNNQLENERNNGGVYVARFDRR
ncbi:MAG: peptidylprolyl isomerase [Clostridium beijerinckii]|nr:peptidylprolyl isomerase [Clostridium beijerinckii]MCI1578589.1 peptidylprolyl isomerase [Clostridium beijerinckii]MCI1582079.1 peptidylprolyl isomerase [Clostridium beijerinckii]MCI1621929.1 peptidylprolyl isomerase [Clostridium beijerinckii]